MIAIIDYGMGNIHSVNKALQLFSAKTVITNKPEDILNCEKAVLPGVGAFDDAMQELEKQGLVEPIKKHVAAGKPFLGICLGMQLLFEKSQEAKEARGLGIFKGGVVKFKAAKGLKVPHMGWNQLKKCQMSDVKCQNGCPLLKNIPDNAFVYFCHSYYPDPKDKQVIAGVTEYGGSFASLVWQENVFGAQFHPEKSQSIGLKILENFVKLC
ncbi:MAG: imidazole glycerol phosphate synthase subunit HisH [Candidatus Omnitrophica bacterium]|nr:imidazole glycerol phosphate synthase subunit HisH [Candidatus Omnitrophota bacterium]